MADRPIIFSGPMVQALLAGRKSQTRRVLKRPTDHFHASYTHAELSGLPGHVRWWDGSQSHAGRSVRLPYAPGDRLYVREAFCPRLGYPAPIAKPHYRADDDKPEWRGLWKPSIHMPRWASRLTLTVTDVRVQRLQDISEADAVAEGVDAVSMAAVPRQAAMSRRSDFAALWNSLHGPDAWAASPWVVALTFSVEQRNIDAGGGNG